MLKKRLIPVLILREGMVVQSVQFKHTNIIHWNAITAVDFFNKWAVDEIIVLDVTRNKQKRKKFLEVIRSLSKKCFVPLTVGGWVDSPDEVLQLLRLGADKVVINTKAVRRPELITECASVVGRQCIVISIDAKRDDHGNYEVYIDRGRESTNLSPFQWSKNAQKMGAGEILINCIDNDGFRQGYDLKLLAGVVEVVDIPVIAMGGVFNWQHLVDGVVIGGADAVAAANIFHYTEHSTKKAKECLRQADIDVR
ncbi:imidazole glycerol phosphate synthase subunit HisF [Thermodesulfobacteriota bacterium]